LELNCCFGSRYDRYTSSIDPHAVLNNFVFLRLTTRYAPAAIAAAPILAMFFVYNDA